MDTGFTRRLPLISVLVLAGAVLAACSGIPAAAAAQLDREAIAALSGTNIEISSPGDLTVGGEIEFTGAVDAIAGANWTIGGVSVLIAPGTEVNGSPAVGDTVKVHGLLQADGSVLAFEVDSHPELTSAPEADETEFTGTVDAIAGDVWTIGGQAVLVESETEIKGSPAVGDTVKVHGLLQADGSILAREIEKLGGDDTQDEDGKEIEITGVVESIAEDAWTIAGQTVLINSETEIKDSPAVGDEVKVQALTQPDGSLLAREIEKADSNGSDGENSDSDSQDENTSPDGQDQIGHDGSQDESTAEMKEIRGTLKAVNGDVWIVNGVLVLVGASAEVDGDPQVGDVVKVEGALLPDGSLRAHTIAVEDKADHDTQQESSDSHHSSGGDGTD